MTRWGDAFYLFYPSVRIIAIATLEFELLGCSLVFVNRMKEKKKEIKVSIL